MFRPRSAPALLLCPALVLGVACKPSVPESFDQLVPAEHRDALTKVIEESEDLKKPGRDFLILWYENEGVSRADLYSAYRSQLEGQGYALMIECELDDPGSMTLAKAPNQAVSASFRDLAGVWHTEVERAEVASIGLPSGDDLKCEFTEAAKAMCEKISMNTCFMKKS